MCDFWSAGGAREDVAAGVAATRRRASTTGATTPSEMAWRCIFALPSAVADDAEPSDKVAEDSPKRRF
jgi:hypothetical protein